MPSQPHFCSQPLEDVHVGPVRPIALHTRDLQEERHILEGWMTHNDAEAIDAHVSFADVLVPVHSRAKGRLTVVGMHGHQVRQADLPVELLHDPFKAVLVSDIVSGGEEVLSIQADLHIWTRQCLHKLAYLLELGADVVSHACAVLGDCPCGR